MLFNKMREGLIGQYNMQKGRRGRWNNGEPLPRTSILPSSLDNTEANPVPKCVWTELFAECSGPIGRAKKSQVTCLVRHHLS